MDGADPSRRSSPVEGAFVEVRGRPWLVEKVSDGPIATLGLSCISDDAQGEQLEVIWDAEVGASILDEDGWTSVGQGQPDEARVLAAYLRSIRWRSATAADRDLLQAPFRAGIRLDAYQLLPLRKALRLPRVNLLIADDVGLGKTIEAGLIARELLLRRRVDLIVIAAPPSMTVQWRDELEMKFGLAFTIIDRERLGEIRRERGYGVNPWATGSRFIVSHALLNDETYVSGLRDILGEFRARALFILDEAHHAAPASGVRYAVSSQLTKAVREITERFEHRLFLTATPHNGHSNSFSALLEMLDPQRFERGIEVGPRELEPVMVRRLKSDLRALNIAAFPNRVVEAVVIDGLPADAPELELARRLAAYGELRERRLGRLMGRPAAQGRLAFVGLQQRLLSSIAAFARTLEVHRRTLRWVADGERATAAAAAALAFVTAPAREDDAELDLDCGAAEEAIAADEDSVTEAASAIGAADATVAELEAELLAVDEMLELARAEAHRPDARVRHLVTWIRANLLDGRSWNRRRLIVFTEYEDTRRWLERRLTEALAETELPEGRIDIFTGATGQDRREAVKRAFNADPDHEPLRILLCTDAAREGINLQTWCADLFHFDLPWNPARLEQRNGRIDRKLQPAPTIACRYFIYAQREADIVLDALVRKTEIIRDQLGSAGQVIEARVARRLTEAGIARGQAEALAKAIAGEDDPEGRAVAEREMDDQTARRRARLLRETEDLQDALERSRERVGVAPDQLTSVAATALSRAGFALEGARGESVGDVSTFRLDPADPAFAGDASWADAFDDLRTRPRKRGERPAEWRRDAPVRAIAFRPPVLADGRDADGVVQVHLEHRLVRRLISRFLSHGFQSKLSRVSVIEGPGAQPRVILMGRLALFGEGAARLHEEIIDVTAAWTESDRDRRPLRPFAGDGVAEVRTLDQLEHALNTARAAPPSAAIRIAPFTQRDIADLVPGLEALATERRARAAAELARRGEDEARSLASLLEAQRVRIVKATAAFDPNQLKLDLEPDERREREANRRNWDKRLARLATEARTEPDRLRRSYEVRAHRLEPVGLIYLWPASG
jgi:SNF2 family DNA or RNA helicase